MHMRAVHPRRSAVADRDPLNASHPSALVLVRLLSERAVPRTQWRARTAERVLTQGVGHVWRLTIRRLQYGLLGLVSSMSAGTPQTTRSRCFATRLWFDMRANV